MEEQHKSHFPSTYVATVVAESVIFINERLAHQADDALQRPEIVYHYTNSAGLLGIVKSQSIWATNIEYLNDAKEFSYARDLAEDVILGLPEPAVAGEQSRFRGCCLEGIRQPRGSPIYVTSFSTLGDSLSQWRGYGAQIGGYALGFTLVTLRAIGERESFENQNFIIVRCRYSEQDQRQLIEKWYEHISNLLVTLRKPKAADEIAISDETLARLASGMLSRVAPAFKHPAFVEEAEWRLVVDLEYVEQPAISLRPGQTTLIPFIAVPLADSGQPLQLAKVIVGPTPLPELATKALHHIFSDRSVTVEEIMNSWSPLRAL